jgi:RNA ligase (TIGR02306 family)
MTRKLARIVQIDNILPHTNADTLELAIVGGWQVVVKKDQFKTGDLAIYCEIDSFIPTRIVPYLTREGYEPKVFNNVQGERLRTIKLRGELSQGLLIVYPSAVYPFHPSTTEIDTDLTEFLGIQKWEAPENLNIGGQAKGSFPSFIPKTDQERCQNLVRKIKESYDNEEDFEVTTKLDGSSMTVFINNGEVGVCSRNQQLKLEDNENNAFVKTTIKSGLIEWLQHHNTQNIAIQGELMGPGIQGNKEKFTDYKFFVFDVFDIDAKEYITAEKRRNLIYALITNGVAINHIPVLHNNFKLTELPSSDIIHVINMADGKSINAQHREGIVFKSNQQQFSFKSISNQWLLKNE